MQMENVKKRQNVWNTTNDQSIRAELGSVSTACCDNKTRLFLIFKQGLINKHTKQILVKSVYVSWVWIKKKKKLGADIRDHQILESVLKTLSIQVYYTKIQSQFFKTSAWNFNLNTVHKYNN